MPARVAHVGGPASGYAVHPDGGPASQRAILETSQRGSFPGVVVRRGVGQLVAQVFPQVGVEDVGPGRVDQARSAAGAARRWPGRR